MKSMKIEYHLSQALLITHLQRHKSQNNITLSDYVYTIYTQQSLQSLQTK